MSDEKKKNKKKIIIAISIIIFLIVIVVSVSLMFLHKNKSDNTENENNSQESVIDTEAPVLNLKENVEITDNEEITTDLFVESCTDNESQCIIKILDNDS